MRVPLASVDLSRLHGVLKDRTRASALELLGHRGSLSYSDLMRLLGIEHTGRLNYHLKVLGDLLDKDQQTGFYSLSEKGRIALALLGKFQNQTTKRPDGIRVMGVLLAMAGVAEFYVGVPNLMSWLGAGVNPFFVFGLSLTIAGLALGILWTGSGIGLLSSKGWAWPATTLSLLATVACQVIEAGSFLAFADRAGLTIDELWPLGLGIAYVTLPALVLAGIGLYYMTRPQTKAYFGRGVKVRA